MEQKIIEIRYEASTAQKRRIQPLGLYTMNGLWYCQAYCFSAADYRVFRVDRISGVQCEVDQSQKVDLDEENIQEWIMRKDEETPLELEVILTPDGVRRCQSDVWLSSFMLVNEDGSGRIQAQMSTSYIPWVVSFFLGLGTDAHVTHPRKFVTRSAPDCKPCLHNMQIRSSIKGKEQPAEWQTALYLIPSIHF